MAIASIPALYRSTVGKKAIMAVTGALMVLFLIGHMVGNLKIFFGLEEFNGYAAWLRTIGEPALHHEWFLWIMRVGLVVVVVMHFGAAAELTARAKRARPVKYQHRPKVNGSYAARTMRWGGVIILLFIIWHILDLTVGVANPHGVHGEAYQNVVAGFAPDRWWVTIFYVVSMIMLGFHLRHGLVSAVQTLGAKNPKHDRTLNVVATGFAVLLSIGFLIVPISVTLGVVD
ncbi:succinate dehydrogenase cytochrome b subunit [Actinocorallia sp. A-T 12471]|uniref:succinate dehydrogenase cytochrome b subunit n=1 Tax=Actinocorallia sp. A-T 12471 TaxID=3089813 RepID=UPI0029CD24C5|nr:succinate dehydrogenase cytochrome b subunit [Actinocorallia sp. A-T 12471]MDX6738646.1 succinate dehydrogenase cytochrome b subunit [Actinocorallia sp. A-T 12471]